MNVMCQLTMLWVTKLVHEVLIYILSMGNLHKFNITKEPLILHNLEILELQTMKLGDDGGVL